MKSILGSLVFWLHPKYKQQSCAPAAIIPGYIFMWYKNVILQYHCRAFTAQACLGAGVASQPLTIYYLKIELLPPTKHNLGRENCFTTWPKTVWIIIRLQRRKSRERVMCRPNATSLAALYMTGRGNSGWTSLMWLYGKKKKAGLSTKDMTSQVKYSFLFQYEISKLLKGYEIKWLQLLLD